MLPPTSTPQRALLDAIAAECGILLRPAWEVINQDVRVQAARSGLGLTVVAQESATNAIERGELTVFDVEGFPIHRDWLAYSLADATHGPTATFRQFLLRHAAEFAGTH